MSDQITAERPGGVLTAMRWLRAVGAVPGAEGTIDTRATTTAMPGIAPEGRAGRADTSAEAIMDGTGAADGAEVLGFLVSAELITAAPWGTGEFMLTPAAVAELEAIDREVLAASIAAMGAAT